MPDITRAGVRVASAGVYAVLSAMGGAPYRRLSPERQSQLAVRVAGLPLPVLSEFSRLTRGLGFVGVYERRHRQELAAKQAGRARLVSRHVDALIVGSGPGGAVSARVLAEAGLETLVVEEGDWVDPGAVESYSVDQMQRQYRNSGLTVALGRPSIAYTEGCGAGGGSEVNSGLYHRPSAELLAAWSRALLRSRGSTRTRSRRITPAWNGS
ncbi:MAG: FAD-dependent monooxygenase [Nocardioidaceae bacterium]